MTFECLKCHHGYPTHNEAESASISGCVTCGSTHISLRFPRKLTADELKLESLLRLADKYGPEVFDHNHSLNY
jgi:predicted  nucleic acid-binding Zn-ribbon protein